MRRSLFGIVLAFCAPVAAHAEDISTRGIIKSLAEATISVDYTARIISLPVLDGQDFAAGDVLIAFDCKRFAAELAAAQANARAQDLVYGNNRKLLARGAIGANEVKVSQAQAEKARAEALAVQARTGSCEYRAPFDGRMVQRIAQEHESPAANQPLIRIVDTGRMEVEILAPSTWLRWLKTGQVFSYRIDETASVTPGEIVRLGATVDPVSQTLKIYGTLIDNDVAVLPGMSGTAHFTLPGS